MTFRLPRTRALVAGAALLAATGLTAGCGSQAGADGDGSTIRYQDSPGIVNLAEMADALGYLHGIKLKDVGVVQGGPQALQALATGQVDLAGAFVGAAANVIAKGTPVKGVIAYYGSNQKVYDEVLVKSGSSIKRPQDLIGKKVAVNTLGAQAEALLDIWFQKAGMTSAQIKKVTLVPLPSINAEAALRHGQVDAALLNGSLLVNAVKGGGLRSVMRDTDLVGSYNGGSYEMSDSFLKAHPATAKEFVGAMARAVVWLQGHSTKQVLAKYTPWLKAHGEGTDATALASWVSTGIASKGGVLSNADFTRWNGWLLSKGLIKHDLDASSLFTNRYNPYAGAGGSSTSKGN